MKKAIQLITAASIMMNVGVFAHASNDVRVVLNGSEMNFDVAPMIINDYTMVPMRAIFEALGYEVQWYPEDQSIIANNYETGISIGLIIGTPAIVSAPLSDTNNATVSELNIAPTIVDGRTLVPLRAVSETSGASVQWDGNTRTVTITTQTPVVQFVYDPQSGYYPDSTSPSFDSVGGILMQYGYPQDGLGKSYMYQYDDNKVHDYTSLLAANGWTMLEFYYPDESTGSKEGYLYVKDNEAVIITPNGSTGQLALSIKVMSTDEYLKMLDIIYPYSYPSYGNSQVPNYSSITGKPMLNSITLGLSTVEVYTADENDYTNYALAAQEAGWNAQYMYVNNPNVVITYMTKDLNYLYLSMHNNGTITLSYSSGV